MKKLANTIALSAIGSVLAFNANAGLTFSKNVTDVPEIYSDTQAIDKMNDRLISSKISAGDNNTFGNFQDATGAQNLSNQSTVNVTRQAAVGNSCTIGQLATNASGKLLSCENGRYTEAMSGGTATIWDRLKPNLTAVASSPYRGGHKGSKCIMSYDKLRNKLTLSLYTPYFRSPTDMVGYGSMGVVDRKIYYPDKDIGQNYKAAYYNNRGQFGSDSASMILTSGGVLECRYHGIIGDDDYNYFKPAKAVD